MSISTETCTVPRFAIEAGTSSEFRTEPALLKRLALDFVRAISLSNLLMLRIWTALLTKDVNCGYTSRYGARPLDLGAATLAMVLLAGCLCAVASLARTSKSGRVLLHWGAALSLGLVVKGLVHVSINSTVLGSATFRNATWRYSILLASAVGVFLWAAGMAIWRERVAHLLSLGLLLSSPFALVTVSEASLRAMVYKPAAYADKPLANRIQTGLPQRRVLWLIFDEMDQRLLFADRDPKLRIVELDKFRAESFSATNALSPNRVTLLSLHPSSRASRSLKPNRLRPTICF